MSKLKRLALASAIMLAVFYLPIALLLWDGNPGNWPEIGRVMWVGLWALMSFTAAVLLFQDE